MNQSNERNNFDEKVEEISNNQDASDFGETAGTFNDAIAGAMIGAQFGLIGTVIGGVSGGAIGNQIIEGAEDDDNIASKNLDESNNHSINK